MTRILPLIGLSGIAWLMSGADSARKPRGAARVSSAAAQRQTSGPELHKLGTPLIGFVATSASELRPLFGIPGAARFDLPLRLPATVKRLLVAPGQGYALIDQGEDQPLATLPLSLELSTHGETVQSANLAGVASHVAATTAGADIVAFSPKGDAVVLYHQLPARLQVITGLPGKPAIAVELGSELLPNEPLAAVAVSDDGAAVLAAVQGSGLFLLSPKSSPVRVHDSTGITSITFAPGSHKAVFCDPAAGFAAVLPDVSSHSWIIPVQAPGDELVEPNYAAFPDERQVLIASSTAKRLWRIDLLDGAAITQALPAAPTRFVLLRDRNTYLLSAEAGEPALILVAPGSGDPQLFFIPKPQPATVPAGELISRPRMRAKQGGN